MPTAGSGRMQSPSLAGRHEGRRDYNSRRMHMLRAADRSAKHTTHTDIPRLQHYFKTAAGQAGQQDLDSILRWHGPYPAMPWAHSSHRNDTHTSQCSGRCRYHANQVPLLSPRCHTHRVKLLPAGPALTTLSGEPGCSREPC